MSDPTPMPRSKARPPTSDDQVVELLPPASFGFGGTALLHAVQDAALIQELIRRGYVNVEHVKT